MIPRAGERRSHRALDGAKNERDIRSPVIRWASMNEHKNAPQIFSIGGALLSTTVTWMSVR